MASNSFRPKRCPRVDYTKLANPTLDLKSYKTTSVKRHKDSPTSAQLFRLEIVDEDTDNELVKVRYIGYDSRFDEWRPKNDVIDLNTPDHEGNELSDNSSNNADERGMVFNGPLVAVSTVSKPFSLYEELAYRVKSLLFSSRKRDPVCCISMSFDAIHFDGLIRRGTLVKGQQTVYTLSTLTKLDDILGQRWYIRGINAAGDFCYVQPGTVRYQLKLLKGQPDFQILEDGTLQECTFGQRHQLTFKFIRSDGILSKWHDTVELCKK